MARWKFSRLIRLVPSLRSPPEKHLVAPDCASVVCSTRSSFRSMPLNDRGDDRWFADAVQPHCAALRSYLHVRFPSLVDIDDLVQESVMRVLRAHATGPVKSPRAFLFTTAS